MPYPGFQSLAPLGSFTLGWIASRLQRGLALAALKAGRLRFNFDSHFRLHLRGQLTLAQGEPMINTVKHTGAGFI